MARLIFDAQVFQTPAWYRGMGKYSLELIRAMATKNIHSKKWDEIDIIISSSMDIDQNLREELTALPRAKLCELDLKPNDILNPAVTAAYNRGIIDSFMVGKGEDTSFIILSLMQGEISPVFPRDEKVRKSVLFYDLIPLMFHKTYLQNPITRKEYLSKLSELFEADTYLAISKTVANDLSVYLGIAPSRIVSIDGGPIVHDTKTNLFKVPRPFILMPTGNDLRKNNYRGIEGFNLFNQKHDNTYTLVITSFFKDEQINELSKLSEKLIFTGNIPGAQLNYLYKETAAVLFPSEYEGLGLPVLEALENDKPVACSDITVFREISPTAFAYFDPTKIHSIADGLEQAITSHLDELDVRKILTKYSWKNTAIAAEDVALRKKSINEEKKTKLVIVGAEFAGESRVGKMIVQSHASLCRLFDPVYYESACQGGVERRINFIPYLTEAHDITANSPLVVNHGDEINVYYITNQKTVARIALLALAHPGILILNDLDLRMVWNELKSQRLVSSERYTLEAKINVSFGVGSTHWIGSLVSNQRAVIVFSKKAEECINNIASKMNKNIRVIYFHLPSNNLVYSDIISSQKNSMLAVGDTVGVDDMQYETMISHSERLIGPSGAMSTEILLPVLETSKYSIPNLPNYEDFTAELYNLVTKLQQEDQA